MRLKILLNLGADPSNTDRLLPPYKQDQVVEEKDEAMAKHLLALGVAKEYTSEEEKKDEERKKEVAEHDRQVLEASRRNLGPTHPENFNKLDAELPSTPESTRTRRNQ